MPNFQAARRFVHLLLAAVYFVGSTDEAKCTCHEAWAKCNTGGEAGASGCAKSGKSCAELCPGSPDKYPWKPLYKQSVDTAASLERECEEDPTAKWGIMEAGTAGPFAVAFAGGLRNFIATWFSWEKNLIEHSGGNVHLYFHGLYCHVSSHVAH